MIYQIIKTEDFELKEWPDRAWEKAEFQELKDVISGDEIEKKARVKMLWSEKFLYVLFDVEDEHIWGTYEKDDDPIYDEEVVEIFVVHGEATAQKYLEIQFSPKGVKYDAKVTNPTGSRHDSGFQVDLSWNSNLLFKQKIEAKEDYGKYKAGKWITQVKIPSVEIGAGELKSGDRLRGNLFRIDGYPEQNSFQALVPNMEKPANFHTPEKFATFELTDLLAEPKNLSS